MYTPYRRYCSHDGEMLLGVHHKCNICHKYFHERCLDKVGKNCEMPNALEIHEALEDAKQKIKQKRERELQEKRGSGRFLPHSNEVRRQTLDDFNLLKVLGQGKDIFLPIKSSSFL